MSIYYQDESVTLYHGDCREVMEWHRADVLITDPPYGIRYADARGQTVVGDNDVTAISDAVRLWGPQAMALFASHVSLPHTLNAVRQQLSRVRVATWRKSNSLGSGIGHKWLSDVEFIVCGVTEFPTTTRSAVISARKFTGNPACQSNQDAYLHPTQKPTPLMQAVLELMPPGMIADPFAGSGSTLVAAKQLGRKAIGVELEERYCEVIAKRLAQGVLEFGEVSA